MFLTYEYIANLLKYVTVFITKVYSVRVYSVYPLCFRCMRATWTTRGILTTRGWRSSVVTCTKKVHRQATRLAPVLHNLLSVSCHTASSRGPLGSCAAHVCSGRQWCARQRWRTRSLPMCGRERATRPGASRPCGCSSAASHCSAQRRAECSHSSRSSPPCAPPRRHRSTSRRLPMPPRSRVRLRLRERLSLGVLKLTPEEFVKVNE